jgi:hypothetical protein
MTNNFFPSEVRINPYCNPFLEQRDLGKILRRSMGKGVRDRRISSVAEG